MTVYLAACAFVFLATYLLNVAYITVFYHRGLCHRALDVGPRVTRFIALTGNWVTGLDAKAWIAMHRLHHTHSDTPQDPHSPRQYGKLGVMLAQLRSYEQALRGLKKGQEPYVSVTKDLDFPIHWLNRNKLWQLPYVLHLATAVAVGYFADAWAFGACYWVGMISHPVQGWLVNAFGHSVGYRNYETPDDSTNNTLVAWFVTGEGYQNNHHQTPSAAKFSHRWFEVDPGYALCLAGELLGLLEIKRGVPKAQAIAPERVLETVDAA
jgi:stearoyl-CoA desaturase (delta-9 desaturase)